MKNEFLNDWVFYFNPYKEIWYAFRRDQYQQFFNGELKNPLRGPKVNDLIDYLISVKGEK